jgi:hypothetical protein
MSEVVGLAPGVNFVSAEFKCGGTKVEMYGFLWLSSAIKT